MAVRILAEPNLFALEQYRFFIIFIDFRQREQTALIVDIGQSGRIADNALAARYAPALAEPAGTVLVGIIAAAPYQRQNTFKGKVGFTLQKLQTVYRIDWTAGTYRTLAGQTGFRGESFAELAVHMEHIASTHDIAFADFNRGRMAHRPGRFGGGAAFYPFTARKGDFIAISFVRLTGIKDKSRLAVEAYVFGDGFGTAEISKEWEGDGWNGRGSGWRRPAEIGDGKDNAEFAAFTGDFIDGHGVLLLGGWGRLKNWLQSVDNQTVF